MDSAVDMVYQVKMSPKAYRVDALGTCNACMFHDCSKVTRVPVHLARVLQWTQLIGDDPLDVLP